MVGGVILVIGLFIAAAAVAFTFTSASAGSSGSSLNQFSGFEEVESQVESGLETAEEEERSISEEQQELESEVESARTAIEQGSESRGREILSKGQEVLSDTHSRVKKSLGGVSSAFSGVDSISSDISDKADEVGTRASKITEAAENIGAEISDIGSSMTSSEGSRVGAEVQDVLDRSRELQDQTEEQKDESAVVARESNEASEDIIEADEDLSELFHELENLAVTEGKFEILENKLHEEDILANQHQDFEEIESALKQEIREEDLVKKDLENLVEDLRDAGSQLESEKQGIMEAQEDSKELIRYLEDSNLDPEKKSSLREAMSQVNDNLSKARENVRESLGRVTNSFQIVGEADQSIRKESFDANELEMDRRQVMKAGAAALGMQAAPKFVNWVSNWAAYDYFEADAGNLEETYKSASKSALDKAVNNKPVKIVIYRIAERKKLEEKQEQDNVRQIMSNLEKLGVKYELDFVNKGFESFLTKGAQRELEAGGGWDELDELLSKFDYNRGADIRGFYVDAKHFESDIRRAFSRENQFFCDFDARSEVLDYVTLHEVGHCLGLCHPEGSGGIMSYSLIRYLKGEIGPIEPTFSQTSVENWKKIKSWHTS